MPTAQEILKGKGNKVITVSPQASVLDAIHTMNEHRIGALVVMNGNGVGGIFTERDVLQRVAGAEISPSQVTVASVMTKSVFCASPETDIDELSEIMRSKRVRHVPICDDAGKLLGLISIGDVNAMHANHQQETISYLSEYIYGRM